MCHVDRAVGCISRHFLTWRFGLNMRAVAQPRRWFLTGCVSWTAFTSSRASGAKRCGCSASRAGFGPRSDNAVFAQWTAARVHRRVVGPKRARPNRGLPTRVVDMDLPRPRPRLDPRLRQPRRRRTRHGAQPEPSPPMTAWFLTRETPRVRERVLSPQCTDGSVERKELVRLIQSMCARARTWWQPNEASVQGCQVSEARRSSNQRSRSNSGPT